MHRKITTLAGTLFLIWFLFTPIVALYSYVNFLSKYLGSFFWMYLLLLYAIFGFLAYRIARVRGDILIPLARPENITSLSMEEMKGVSLNAAPWYAGVIYIASFVPILYGKYVIEFGTSFPLLGSVIGIALCVGVCLVNWYQPLRKRANFFLTHQTNEQVAYAQAQTTLYAMNGLLVFIGGLLLLASYTVLMPN